MKKVDVPFGHAYTSSRGIVVLEIQYGAHVTKADSERCWHQLQTLCGGPFVLIVDRVNIYSHDVTGWKSIAGDPRLRAVIVIAYRPLTWKTAEFVERHFVPAPFFVVPSMERALLLATPYLMPRPPKALVSPALPIKGLSHRQVLQF